MAQDESEKRMPDDIKGKGIATHSNNLSPSPTSQDDRSDSTQIGAPAGPGSIMSRLGASASKLTEDMIMQRPGGAQIIANALSSGKAESSGAAKGASVQEAASYKSRADPATYDRAFKSTRSREQSASDESNFSSFLDETGVLKIAETGHIENHTYEQDQGLDSEKDPQALAIMETDGMGVVSLLNSGYDEADEIIPPLTDDEKVALRSRLFDDSDNSRGFSLLRGRWQDVLNFFPDFESNSNSSTRGVAGLLGTSDLEEARHIWVSQWQCVLSSYTDEVWGDLGPLVNVAREELDNLLEPLEDLPSKPKALHRLQQILKHVRGM
ncbi:hypothetical protein F5B19DRAFT_443393 [Rostrohypoxylon terebratum]|nr:hypothetical protein F5B19DRAFT_443393 [Rostrohypoxylon terebratum]